jgi:hypothetical protein
MSVAGQISRAREESRVDGQQSVWFMVFRAFIAVSFAWCWLRFLALSSAP